jgi:hypothetical protein
MAQMAAVVLGYNRPVPSVVLCVAAFGLLAGGVWVQVRKLTQKT